MTETIGNTVKNLTKKEGGQQGSNQGQGGYNVLDQDKHNKQQQNNQQKNNNTEYDQYGNELPF